jgi:hypothetical protein
MVIGGKLLCYSSEYVLQWGGPEKLNIILIIIIIIIIIIIMKLKYITCLKK